MRDREDRLMESLFRQLQDRDQERVPDFETLMARAREEASLSGTDIRFDGAVPRHIKRRFAWGGSLVAAAAVVLLSVGLPGTSDSEFVEVVQTFSSNPASGAWKSPTDGLLDLPGKEILTTVPSISSRRWLPDPSGTPRRNEL